MKNVMKMFAALVMSIAFVAGAQAASLGVFGGVGSANGQALSESQVGGGSGAAILGVAGTAATAGNVSGSVSRTAITPNAVTTTNTTGTQSTGGSLSGALGLGAGASTFGAVGGGAANGQGVFGKAGLFALP